MKTNKWQLVWKTGQASAVLGLAFVMMLAWACVGPGCASTAVGNDPVVVNAERATTLTLEAFDTFLAWEFNNRATLSGTPQIRAVADNIRANGIAWLRTARSMTMAYKNARTPENKANLNIILATLQEALAQVKLYNFGWAGDEVLQAIDKVKLAK